MEKALKKHAPIFVLPTFLAFVIGFIIPFAQGFYLSFCKFTTVGNATFVGISNYTAAIKDTSFTSSFKIVVTTRWIPPSVYRFCTRTHIFISISSYRIA